MRIQSNEPYERQVLPSEEIPLVKSLSEERSREIPQVPANPIWNALGKSADIVYDVANNMMEVERLEELNKAHIELSKRITQSRIDITNDPTNREKNASELVSTWKEKSSTIKNEVVDTVKNKKNRMDLMRSWQANDNDGTTHYTDQGWKNSFAQADKTIDLRTIQLTSDFLNSDPARATAEYKQMMAGYVKTGILTEKVAALKTEQFINNTTREYYQRQLITQIQNNPNNFETSKVILQASIENEPNITENDKTILLHNLDTVYHTAKTRAKQNIEVEQEKTAYAGLVSRFGNDNEAATKWIRNPKNNPDLPLTVRNRLAATMEHMAIVQEHELGKVRDKTMNEFLPRIYGGGNPLTSQDIFDSKLSPVQKEHFLKLLLQPPNKKDFTTNMENYNNRLQDAYLGKIQDSDDIFSDSPKYDGIGIKDREHIWQVNRVVETPDKRLTKQSFDELDRYINSTTLIKVMAPKAPPKGASEEQKALYNQEMHNFTYNTSIEGRKAKAHAALEKALEEGKKKDKTISEMLDRNNKDNVLTPILKSSTMSYNEQQEANKKFKEEVKEKMNQPTSKTLNKSELKTGGNTDEEISWATKELIKQKVPVNNTTITEAIKRKRDKVK